VTLSRATRANTASFVAVHQRGIVMARTLRRSLSALLFALPAIASAQTPAGLSSLLAAEASRYPGSLGVYVKHLTTGEEAGVRADQVFNAASVIKLPILALAMQQVDAGTRSLATRLTITAENKRGGSGILQRFDAGLQPTYRDVLAQMVMTSDNTATDLVIEQVGGVDRVNAWIAANGGGMHLFYTVAQVFAKVREPGYTANPRDAVANNKAYWLGEITPRSIGRLLERLQRCQDGTGQGAPLASKSSCDQMLRMLRMQLSGDRRLAHYLEIPVAHKTGDWPPLLANDVGILYTRSGPVVVVVCANNITGSYGEAEDRIGELARSIVKHFDGPR
jgi:beta-lactamase class A